MHGQNGLQFGTLMYPDHLQYCLFWSQYVDFPHFGSILLSERSKNCGFHPFSGESIGGMAWNLTWWCISPAVSSTSQNNTMLSVCERKAVLHTMQKLDTKTLWHHIMYLLAVSSGTLSDQWLSARLQYLKCNRKQILICCHWQLIHLKERRQCSLEKS